MRRKNRTPAIAYLRTSSATNVGADKDSDKRQREAIASFARVPAMSSWVNTMIRLRGELMSSRRCQASVPCSSASPRDAE